MIRVPLNQGETIQLNNQNYTIATVIGDGANCVVYSAYYLDSAGFRHNINLKECYPYHATIEREHNKLIWESEAEQTKAFSTFRIAYEKLMNWQNENFAVSVFDLCEENNTLYIIMNADKGVTYDRVNSDSLNDILKTIKLLAHFAGKYHENGYLHLDIKPSNFLVYPRPSEHIVLFDLDSVTPISDVEDGLVKFVSYSEVWAAPEQKQGKISKLCPATDIYSIGAILFEKVMGRHVTAFDMSVYADWDFEGDMFENVNPSVKRYLREIFKKTLAPSPQRRYQSVHELIAALNKAWNVTIDGKPYLQSNFKGNTINFIGREYELEEIHKAFRLGNRAVFLHGEGGIGKSTLALAYGEKYMRYYDAILFLKYKGSLWNLLREIQIQNFDGEDHGFKQLKRLLNQHILLIVDNFDVEIDQDDYLDDLLELETRILVTSRTDFSSVEAGVISHVEIEGLPDEQLRSLFCNVSGITFKNETDYLMFDKILKRVDRNTYVVELLGRQIAASHYGITKLWDSISQGMKKLEHAEKIQAKKDGKNHKSTVPDILRVLFRIADLSEERKQALRDLYMLRFLQVDRAAYIGMTYEKSLNVLNDLVELGWVKHNSQYYWLHPLIEDMIQLDLTPNMKNCSRVFRHISYMIYECLENSSYSLDKADSYRQEYYRRLLCAFFLQADFSDAEVIEMVVSWLWGELTTDHVEIGSVHNSWFKMLYNKLLQGIERYSFSIGTALKIHCIYFVAWLDTYRYIYTDPDTSLQRMEERELGSNRSFESMMNVVEHILRNNPNDNMITEMVETISSYLDNSGYPDYPKDYIRSIYNLCPSAFTMEAYRKETYDLPLTECERNEMDEWRSREKQLHVVDKDEQRMQDELNECIRQFSRTTAKAAFIASIAEAQHLSYFQRVERITECTDNFFFRKHIGIWRKEDVDWNEINKVLLIEKKLLFASDVDLKSMSEEQLENWSYYIGQNTVNCIITSAALGNEDEIKYGFEIIYERIKHEVLDGIRYHRCSKDEIHFWYSYNAHNQASILFRSAIRGLQAIRKSNYALSYLLQYTAGWEKYYGEKTEDLLPVYQDIVDCAEDAIKYGPSDQISSYKEVHSKYQDLIAEITDTATYKVRPVDDNDI